MDTDLRGSGSLNVQYFSTALTDIDLNFDGIDAPYLSSDRHKKAIKNESQVTSTNLAFHYFVFKKNPVPKGLRKKHFKK